MSGAIGTSIIGYTPIGGAFVQQVTVADIVRQALLNMNAVSLSQTIYAEDIMQGATVLNQMVAQWNRRRWLIWHLIDVAVETTGAQKYSVGIGGDFDVVRPDQLEAAYFRQVITGQPNEVDYPLTIIKSYEDYSLIALKTLVSWPAWLFYDSAQPLGYVYPWPIPQQSGYFLHLVIKDMINGFPSLTSQINLPPEYFEAIWSNLAIRLAPMYPTAKLDTVAAIARSSLETIRSANAQIPNLQMPPGLGRGGLYNIYSDQTY